MKVVFDTDQPSILRLYFGDDYLCNIPSYHFQLAWSDKNYNRVVFEFGSYKKGFGESSEESVFVKKLQQEPTSPGKGGIA